MPCVEVKSVHMTNLGSGPKLAPLFFTFILFICLVYMALKIFTEVVGQFHFCLKFDE
jgi:hypothetical protein